MSGWTWDPPTFSAGPHGLARGPHAGVSKHAQSVWCFGSSMFREQHVTPSDASRRLHVFAAVDPPRRPSDGAPFQVAAFARWNGACCRWSNAYWAASSGAQTWWISCSSTRSGPCGERWGVEKHWKRWDGDFLMKNTHSFSIFFCVCVGWRQKTLLLCRCFCLWERSSTQRITQGAVFASDEVWRLRLRHKKWRHGSNRKRNPKGLDFKRKTMYCNVWEPNYAFGCFWVEAILII